MKPVAFEYCRPGTIAEALALLEEFGADATVLAGGMSLGAMLNMRLVRPVAVVDIKRIAGLDGVTINGEVRTGATLRQAAALGHAALMGAVPLLARALPNVGHFQTRNRGTLGGSVAHADPSSEIPLTLATLGGSVELQSKRGVRRVAARDFFLDILTTTRASDELLTALVWPKSRPGAGYAFAEIAQRHGDFAIVACAAEAVVKPDGSLAHLAFGLGGVESRPLVVDTGASLGKQAGPGLAAEIAAAAAASVSPMSDFKATADYRRALILSLGRDVLAEAFARAH
ncbi:MAG: FAD binding domain-containing protein [Proteobacteria bacterium]|nr:FAD binding domain-containing protein [Pseudomonadota bacterium]